MLPIIGVTLDFEEGGGYSKLPWYAIRENYLSSIWEAGALPLPLPHHTALAGAYLDQISGLIVTGGAFDIAPNLYGSGETHPTVSLKARRTEFEWAMTEGALKRDMPVLGICGGEQLLNVVLGGTLIQHIPDRISEPLAHEQPNPRTEPGHAVTVTEGTLLHKIAGTRNLSVNSAHHQAVDRPGKNVIVNALAEDGVIEGIECPDYRFCLGVQWHPEYHVSPADKKIFEAFVKAATSL